MTRVTLHCSNKTVLKNLVENDIESIEDILTENNKIMEFSDFKTIIQGRENKKALHNKVKKNFEENGKLSEWMARIPDDTRLVRMNLPGTHDTCTCELPSLTSQVICL